MVVVDCGGGQIRLLVLPHQIWVRAEFSLHNFVTYSYCGSLWDVLPLGYYNVYLLCQGIDKINYNYN
jgi:hypothetical protein